MSTRDLSNLRALVGDDEEFLRRVVARMLRHIGVYSVLLAGDGDEAAAIIAEPDDRLDLVICDISMPSTGGLEPFARVRSSTAPDVADVPFIILTGHPHPEHVTAAARFCVDQFLAKPISREVLEERFRAAIG